MIHDVREPKGNSVPMIMFQHAESCIFVTSTFFAEACEARITISMAISASPEKCMMLWGGRVSAEMAT